MLQSRSIFAVLCLVGYSNALVDYEHAVHHIARVIQDHSDNFYTDPNTISHVIDTQLLKEQSCRTYEPDHHKMQECYTIFELDPCKSYLDDVEDYENCQGLALEKGARKV